MNARTELPFAARKASHADPVARSTAAVRDDEAAAEEEVTSEAYAARSVRLTSAVPETCCAQAPDDQHARGGGHRGGEQAGAFE
ncbi:hypothetical protein [Nocardia gipuzkoensis]